MEGVWSECVICVEISLLHQSSAYGLVISKGFVCYDT